MLFFAQVGTVAAITACIVGVMTLFYAEVIALDNCNPEKLIKTSERPLCKSE
tara:strand:- start:582 stop:737 length:156 start_codon:yes stop_codon:yes gene_type:complete